MKETHPMHLKVHLLKWLSLSGTVFDFQSGEALTGVEVSIEGTDIKVYTDFDGNFEIDNVKPGNLTLLPPISLMIRV